MKIFFDTEFTGLQKDADLISIGMVTESGKELYAEFSDFDRCKCSEWVEDNVLSNTIHYGNKNVTDVVTNEDDYYFGTKEEIAGVILHWLNEYDYVEFYSDVSHYDFVLFADLFGGALNMPEKLPACCHDINQDIAEFYHIDDVSAFDMSREEILVNGYGMTLAGDKHNSLYDARVIQSIYINIKG